jgi:hypothetical protein
VLLRRERRAHRAEQRLGAPPFADERGGLAVVLRRQGVLARSEGRVGCSQRRDARARLAKAGLLEEGDHLLERRAPAVHRQHRAVGRIDHEEGGPHLLCVALDETNRLGAIGVDAREDVTIGELAELGSCEHLVVHRQTGVAPGRPAIDEHELRALACFGERGVEVVLDETRRRCGSGLARRCRGGHGRMRILRGGATTGEEREQTAEREASHRVGSIARISARDEPRPDDALANAACGEAGVLGPERSTLFDA